MSEPKAQLLKRFEEKVSKSQDCWRWNAYINQDGYGTIRVDGRMKGAHRVSFELYNGAIPIGMEILHACDNPWCVNPSHLSAGTHKKNMSDMALRGRAAKGASAGGRANAKLTDAQVLVIREAYKAGFTQRSIGKYFSLSQSQVYNIGAGLQWRHLL